MSTEINAFKCDICGKLFYHKEEADNCCKCTNCKRYIGKVDARWHYVHCKSGYSCTSFESRGEKGTYNMFEPKC